MSIPQALQQQDKAAQAIVACVRGKWLRIVVNSECIDEDDRDNTFSFYLKRKGRDIETVDLRLPRTALDPGSTSSTSRTVRRSASTASMMKSPTSGFATMPRSTSTSWTNWGRADQPHAQTARDRRSQVRYLDHQHTHHAARVRVGLEVFRRPCLERENASSKRETFAHSCARIASQDLRHAGAFRNIANVPTLVERHL